MHLHENPLFRRCVECDSEAPKCIPCSAGEQCIIVGRGCDKCSYAECAPIPNQNSGGGGISKGALAGGIIGALIFLIASISLFIWYRRRMLAQTGEGEVKPDVPPNPEDVLNRPDPVEKPKSPTLAPHTDHDGVKMYNAMSNSIINLDPFAQYSASGSAGNVATRRASAQGSVRSNPFTDVHSIQTASDSTQSTNVIPIALVPHGSVSTPPRSPGADQQSRASSNPSVPSRPPRSPELNIRLDPLSSGLNLEHINVSSESFRPPNAPYAHSQLSGLSGISSRESCATFGSFASDVLSEAPQIVTPNSGTVRQVLGVAKAEVILAPGPQTPHTADSRLGVPPGNGATSGKSGAQASRPPARSPLAQSSFGPSDVAAESDAEGDGQVVEIPLKNAFGGNPFGDEHTPRFAPDNYSMTSSIMSFSNASGFPMPPSSVPTFAHSSEHGAASSLRGSIVEGGFSFTMDENKRPLSESTQAGSLIAADVASATIVNLGGSEGNPNGVRVLNRMTSGKLVSPASAPFRAEEDSTLQRQQAIAYARAQGVAPPLPGAGRPGLGRRTSEASVASAGGDSLLESFTFVPPSPISSRPQRSPLAQQTFQRQQQQMSTPPVAASGPAAAALQGEPLEPPQAVFRHQQAMSTASAGSALEGYTFHIEHGPMTDSSPSTPGMSEPLKVPSGLHNDTRDSDATLATLNMQGNTHASRVANNADKQRASLDTLALTTALSAFPLDFGERHDSFTVTK